MKPLAFKGEITAFLSLIFILLLSMIGAMVQSASIHITKSMKRADMQLAMECIFAEYHSELLEEYGIFAKEGAELSIISRRLEFYGISNMEHRIEKIELLSDHQGKNFYEQAVRLMGGDVKEEEIPEEESVEEEAKNAWEELETLLQNEEQSLPEENNPIETATLLQKMNILTLVLSENKEVSEKTVELETLPSHRELQVGSGVQSQNVKNSIVNRVLFAGYLQKYFPHFQDTAKDHPLCYEAEYLLACRPSDRENLNEVAQRLVMIRMGVNYLYLISSQERQIEAQTMALALSSLLAAPEAMEVVKQALLFAWAYGESILDLRSLFAGGKVPTVKTDANWNLQLANLSKLLENEKLEIKEADDEGMSYGEYIKILFLMEDEKTLSMRALDLLELNLGIRVDDCVTELQMKSSCRLQRNIIEVFSTRFAYE